MNETDRNVRELCERIDALVGLLTGNKPGRALGPDDWISPAELGDRTGTSKSAVLRWIDLGLPAKRMPRGYLIRYGDFLAWRQGDEDARRALASVRGRLAG